jgi:hypothetical protein
MSATDLVRLTLCNILQSGYTSPEAIATCLAVLVNREYLTIGFKSPLSRPDLEGRRPPPPTYAILPSLTRLLFKGASEYLEDLVARIDAPSLDSIWITFFNGLIFDLPRLAQFTRRTTRFQALNEVRVDFDNYAVQVGYFPPRRQIFDDRSGLRISCRSWVGSFHLWRRSLHLSSLLSTYMVEHLYIHGPGHLSEE